MRENKGLQLKTETSYAYEEVSELGWVGFFVNGNRAERNEQRLCLQAHSDGEHP